MASVMAGKEFFRMNQRCAWCNKVYGKKESSVMQTTHGACPACVQRFIKKLQKRDMESAKTQATVAPANIHENGETGDAAGQLAGRNSR